MFYSVYNFCLYGRPFCYCPDPARVINMPPVIYVPRKLPGIIRCPVDANPPVMSVKWEKDGYPLRVEKVCVYSEMFPVLVSSIYCYLFYFIYF